MDSIRLGDVVGATMKMVSRDAALSQPATGSDSSTGRSGTMMPATPAWAASAAKRRGSCARIGLMYVIRTIGMPSWATAAASSKQAPTVIPCSRAVWPACWITGPSASGSEKGMPISSAATPEVASFFPTSSERFLFGWPAIM